MIRAFGLYPRFFVKKKNILYPIIEKYSGSAVGDKSQGQIIKIYFNLLRTNDTFKADIDALISQAGSKLLTVQERLLARKATKEQKAKKDLAVDSTQPTTVNFLNATDVTSTELTEASEADFIAAIAAEEKEETFSQLLKLAGVAILLYGAWYVYEHYIE